jgi:hypothetical protein
MHSVSTCTHQPCWERRQEHYSCCSSEGPPVWTVKTLGTYNTHVTQAALTEQLAAAGGVNDINDGMVLTSQQRNLLQDCKCVPFSLAVCLCQLPVLQCVMLVDCPASTYLPQNPELLHDCQCHQLGSHRLHSLADTGMICLPQTVDHDTS